MPPDGEMDDGNVHVMGLNKNKGQEILLRLRTDDFRGFRKILSVRKVLYHALAHNDISAHNTRFFELMRRVEREAHERQKRGAAPRSIQLRERPDLSLLRREHELLQRELGHLPLDGALDVCVVEPVRACLALARCPRGRVGVFIVAKVPDAGFAAPPPCAIAVSFQDLAW